MHDVHVVYGDTVILDHIDWTVHAGEHWAVVGPNGAGKSTLLSLVTGDNLLAYANDVCVFGRRRGSGESIWDLRAQIGWMGPDLGLHMPSNASCLDVVLSGYNGTLALGPPASSVQIECARSLLMSLGIGISSDSDRDGIRGANVDHERSVPFGALPQAGQRLVLLARALVNEPRLLLLDEPCQGLDRAHVALVRDAIDSFVGTAGKLAVYHP